VLAGSAQRAKSACRHIFPSPSLSLLCVTFNKPPFLPSRNLFLALLRKYKPWLACIEGLIIVWVCRDNGATSPWRLPGGMPGKRPPHPPAPGPGWAGTRCPGFTCPLRSSCTSSNWPPDSGQPQIGTGGNALPVRQFSTTCPGNAFNGCGTRRAHPKSRSPNWLIVSRRILGCNKRQAVG
jgi:hypothetical protein